MRWTLCVLLAACLCAVTAWPQSGSRRQDQRLRQELKSGYLPWRDQDVAYILTDEERAAFNRLNNDEEREQFIEEFWRRRDPTPDTAENEFKEEHYRRIAYANEHFASGMPGWKTDRGRIYIVFGPPDEIESHPSGGTYQRTTNEGGGSTSTFPFERWRYRYIEDIGNDVVIEFVDPTMSGEYRMTIDPNEKDALQKVPGHQPPEAPNVAANNPFDRLRQLNILSKPPRMPELLGVAQSVVSYNLLPFLPHVSYFPLTEASTLVYVSVQLENRDLQFQTSGGVSTAALDVAGGVTTITGRSVATFEDRMKVETPSAMLTPTTQRKSIFTKALILAPGAFRLKLAAKDTTSGATGLTDLALSVPRLEPGSTQISSIVLADLVERVPTRSAGSGQFVIGDYKVRPRVDGVFRSDERLGVYFQLWGAADETIELEIIQNGTNTSVIEHSQNARKTVVEQFDLAGLTPGQYSLRVTVGHSLRRIAPFQIRN